MLLLPYDAPLRQGLFLKREKRFMVHVELSDGTTDIVHCPNSGSMKSCLDYGCAAYTLLSPNPDRKLKHTLELLQLQDGLACLNTGQANHFVYRLLEETIGKPIQNSFQNIGFPYEKFQNYTCFSREVKYNVHTRFDFCLTTPSSPKKCWIEVKSVTLRRDDGSYAFPDAVTTRGQKHLEELMHAKRNGDDAYLFFVLMRGSNVEAESIATHFSACSEIDPVYAELLVQAKHHGVGVCILVPSISVHGFSLRLFHWG